MSNILKFIKVVMPALLVGVALQFSSCTEDPNLWDTDDSYNRTFRPATAGTKSLKANAVTLVWSKVVGVSEYQLLVSTNADFSDPIVNQKVSPDTAVKSDEVTFSLSDLAGETTYYVSISSISKTEGVANSKPVLGTFKTLPQQIMEEIRESELLDGQVTVRWATTEGAVNRVALVKAGNRTDSISYDLTADEIANGVRVITGLENNQAYYVAVYQNNARRGFRTFSTQTDIERIIPFAVGQTVEELVADINESLAIGKVDITVVFENGATYFESIETPGAGTSVVLPAGIERMRFTSDAGVQPKLMIASLSFDGMMKSMTYNNVWLFTGEANKYVFDDASKANRFPQELYLTNSIVEGYVGVCRLRTTNTFKASYDNCVFKKIGSYSLLYPGTATSVCTGFSVTNSTLIECLYFLDGRNYTPTAETPCVITDNTFYNNEVNMTYFMRLGANPSAGVTVANNILAFSNPYQAKLLYSGSGYNNVDFSSLWITNNFTYDPSAAAGFLNNQTFAGGAKDLFVDAEKGDFRFKPTVSGGILQAGDPQWRHE